ncbi:ATP-binding protein [Dinoroseobacter sp. PD6]|uniref:PAS domain-containing hybrid sensor histidine kinase/response regulator n=1 Tax=Dinoroseobacter sp. PD6 TaxID=3028384 RepID=UPI00237A4380|nr:PAS domain-containing hybrid sensor histidine kinase/response regulator [Dinoroseobacter sp. PD6]MDD9717799.1 ATP-binding protein [Dinoroseobacter sp. PD6]
MPQPAPQAQNARQKFENRTSDEGRFAAYARGRVGHFAARQVLTLLGALILWVLVSPQMGLLALALALLGEAVDCLSLWVLIKRRNFGRGARIVSTGTAAVQALSIAACVWIGWHATAGPEARFFAVAYLCGAIINASLVFPYNRRATEARLVIYILVIAVLFALDGLQGRGGRAQLVFDSLATVLLLYMAYSFVSFVLRSYTKRIKMEREMLEGQERLDRSYQTLRAREREARHLAMVAANANDSVIVTDRAGHIEYVNASFTRVTGYTVEEALGRTPAELLNGPNTDTEAIEAILNARRTHEPVRLELINRTKFGKDIWVETNITPMMDSDGNVVGEVAIERDITQAKQREQELAAAKTAAEEGARAKAQFLAMISHEIRTPLNGIIGMSDVMLSGPLDPEHRGNLQTILASGEGLLTIINDILDLSKLEAGKMEIDQVPFDLRAELQAALDLVRPLANEKGLSLSVDVSGLPEGRILGDPGRVRQVFLNLMGNAIKFTRAGAVSLRAAVDTGAAPPRVTLAVQDTGIGIPADRLDQIFDAFAQADSATTRDFGGTGLGLAISRQLTQQMGGDITVTSVPGKGSCFTMEFVTGLDVMQPVEVSPRICADDEADLPASLRLLIADDNRTNRLLLGKLLSPLKDGMRFAKDGVEAVEAFVAEVPDLILMDMSMPRCDGLEATRRIRALEASRCTNAPVPIIALTANAFASDRERCLAAGMDGFLTKPIRRNDLLTTIARATRNSAIASDNAAQPPPRHSAAV